MKLLSIGTQGADVHHLLDTPAQAGTRELLGQGNMHFIESLLAAMQNRHQIHDSIMPRHDPGERHLVVNIKLQHSQHRQMLHMLRVASPAGGHGDAPALTRQFFTDMSTHKAGTTQDQYFFHVSNLAR